MDFHELDRDWLKQQMQEYQLTVKQLVAEMGSDLAGATIRKFLVGDIEWPLVLRPIKKEIFAELERIFGSSFSEEKLNEAQRIERRTPKGTTEILTDEQIWGLVENPDHDELLYPNNPPKPVVRDSSSPPLKNLSEIPDYYVPCNRCGTLIWGVDEGTCPNPKCGRLSIDYI